MLPLSKKRLKSSKENDIGIITVLAKTYGNYLLTKQALKVAETIKEDENTVVSLGKLLLVDKLMDTATWLMKPEDKE